jgi:hypothetical protein
MASQDGERESRERIEQADFHEGENDLAWALEKANERVAALEAAHADCDVRIRDLCARNADLVRLTSAAKRLAASLHRESVLSAIEGIVVDLIGSSEVAIFELDEVDGDVESLRLARVLGLDPKSPRLTRAGGPLRYALGLGQTLVARGRRVGADDADGGLTAAVPLKVEGRVTGAIAIFRLLDHKEGLSSVDHELFEILSRQAAVALQVANAMHSTRPTVRPPRNS